MEKRSGIEAFSTPELVQELRRRIDELNEARELLAEVSQPARKSSKMSDSKKAYWAEWREYKAKHPGATTVDWQKARRKA